MYEKRVIVAMDGMSLAEAHALTLQIGSEVAGVKFGFELLCDVGAERVMELIAPTGVKVMFDPKLHDIPTTAEKAARNLDGRGAWIVNLHCSGGRKMMEAVRKAVDDRIRKLGVPKPLIIGVTVLTSLTLEDLAETGETVFEPDEIAHLSDKEKAEVLRNIARKRAILAKNCGLDGAVCSPKETAAIREACGPNFIIITPGIRLPDAKADDQARVATPAGAIEAGANYLVIGRPVTQAEDPLAALRLINQQVAKALAKKEGAVTA